MSTNFSHISRAHISKSEGCFNMKTKISADSQICISVTLKSLVEEKYAASLYLMLNHSSFLDQLQSYKSSLSFSLVNPYRTLYSCLNRYSTHYSIHSANIADFLSIIIQKSVREFCIHLMKLIITYIWWKICYVMFRVKNKCNNANKLISFKITNRIQNAEENSILY